MKFLLFILILINSFHSKGQQQDKQFKLIGTVTGQNEGWIILSYTNSEGINVKDSALLKNGSFIITGKISYPTMAFLSSNLNTTAPESDNSTNFYLEPNTIQIALEVNNFKNRVISGSLTEIEVSKLGSQTNQIRDTGEIKNQKIFQLMQEFISTHPKSYYSIFLLFINKNSWPFKKIQSLYYQLDSTLYITQHGKFITKIIKEIEANSPGKPAKSFTALDWKENALDLNKYKGKFVLLDFWASWCVPCRETTPKLIELYNRFHNKGFEVIAISIDNDVNQWKKAIVTDKTDIWNHIVSNKYSSELARIDKLYGVSTLPTKILIDKNGMIIGRFSGTEEDKELEEMLSKEID